MNAAEDLDNGFDLGVIEGILGRIGVDTELRSEPRNLPVKQKI